MIEAFLWNSILFAGLFLFYSVSVLYSNWSGYKRGFEQGRSLRNEQVE